MPGPLAPIRVLDDATIDRIAAGEVVERPASVIKELCENALDAGATSLAIDLEEGGLVRLSVEDDGHGVPFRELPLAFERHATSKIASAADIMRVDSFGFRGEALAAIASVSRTTMVSRCEDENVGGLIELDGGAIQRREPAPRNRGTTVTVEDLFYNTPARRKFMKTAQAERRAVVRMVTALAAAHWEVRWVLREGSSVLLDLSPAPALPGRVRDILGAAVSEHLVRFEKESGGFSVAGLASRPTWSRGNREQQLIFVNRRAVDNTTLSQAIAQAYREVVPPGKHPVVIAFLQLPAGEVDVNVHPAKTEVRLLLERQAFGLLRSALEEGLDLRDAEHLRPYSGEVAEDGTAVAGADVERVLVDEAARLRQHLGRGASAGYEHRGVPEGQGELFGAAAMRPAAGTVAAAPESSHTAPFWQLHRTYIVTQTAAAWCSSTSTTATNASSTTRPAGRSRTPATACPRSNSCSPPTSTSRPRSCRPSCTIASSSNSWASCCSRSAGSRSWCRASRPASRTGTRAACCWTCSTTWAWWTTPPTSSRTICWPASPATARCARASRSPCRRCRTSSTSSSPPTSP